MTTAQTSGQRPGLALLVRTSLIPTVASGAASGLVFLTVEGAAGLAGAVAGALLVVGFFGIGRLVLEVMRIAEPSVYLIIALLTYGLQLLGLIAIFAVLESDPSWHDRLSETALGVTTIGCTLVWTTGLVVASRRERTPLYDLESGGR